MNAYTEDFEIEDLGSRTSSEITRALVPGAMLVKAFNTIYYKRLSDGKAKANRGVSRSRWLRTTRPAKTVVMEFDRPDRIRPGRQRRTGQRGGRQQPGSPVYNEPIGADEMRRELARA